MSTALVRAELTAPGEESVRPDDPSFVYKGELKKSSLSNRMLFWLTCSIYRQSRGKDWF